MWWGFSFQTSFVAGEAHWCSGIAKLVSCLPDYFCRHVSSSRWRKFFCQRWLVPLDPDHDWTPNLAKTRLFQRHGLQADVINDHLQKFISLQLVRRTNILIWFPSPWAMRKERLRSAARSARPSLATGAPTGTHSAAGSCPFQRRSPEEAVRDKVQQLDGAWWSQFVRMDFDDIWSCMKGPPWYSRICRIHDRFC